MNKAYISSFISGLIFAIGLGLSGMMSPEKVQGFMDITGKWDPSLAMVMGGAVMVTFFSFPFVFKRKKPVFEKSFALPGSNKVDKNLILGAILFGAGWGIGGLCPGPAIANIGSLNPGILLFIASMLTGFYFQQNILSVRNNKTTAMDQCTVD